MVGITETSSDWLGTQKTAMIGRKQGQRTALIGRAHRQNMMHWHERASICIGGFQSIQNALRNIHGRPLPGYDFWTHSQRTALIGRTHRQNSIDW